MSEAPRSDFWRKPRTGWSGRFLWFALVASAIFVLIFCFGMASGTNDSLLDVAVRSFLLAVGISVVIGSGALFIRWLCHWRNLRRFLFVSACLVTLIMLFFTEEHWRGKRAWTHYRDAQIAKGEKMTTASLAPPPVPDEKNFAFTPLLKPSYDFAHTTNGVRWRDTKALEHLQKVRVDLSSHPERLALGSLEKGTFADLEVCRSFYRGNTNYPQPEVSGTAAADILVALGKFDAELQELRTASDTRPESRFPIEYDYDPSWAILLPHLTHVKGIAKIAQLRAVALLELGQSEEAFKDLKLGFRLSDSIRNEPILIDQLVRAAILSLNLQIVREGLVRHAWSDAQLTELEQYLGSLDLLAEFKLGMRGERALSVEGLDYYRRQGNRASPLELLNDLNGPDGRPDRSSVVIGSLSLVSGGFYYQNMRTIAELHEKFTLPSVDEKAHRVFPQLADDLDREIEVVHQKPFAHPYRIFSAVLFPALSKANAKAGRIQTYVDEARIACALERFRLANGQLPDTLDTLVPRFIAALPHDMIDGQPLRFRRASDGGYVLYSIGWNRVDDGGNAPVKSGPGGVNAKISEAGDTDAESGDWVWSLPGK
jgi:hypothetical protein